MVKARVRVRDRIAFRISLGLGRSHQSLGFRLRDGLWPVVMARPKPPPLALPIAIFQARQGVTAPVENVGMVGQFNRFDGTYGQGQG